MQDKNSSHFYNPSQARDCPQHLGVTILNITRLKCTYHLQIGQQDIPAHRVVLAAASPYLMELFAREDIGFRPSRKEVYFHFQSNLQ